MNVLSFFWFAGGAMVGVCATLVIVPLLRDAGGRVAASRARAVWLAGGTVAVAIVATLAYLNLGRPELIAPAAAAANGAPHSVGAGGDGGAPDSMESATARLEQRLAAGQGTDQDWLLLAQSYEFLGRSADAERARKHELPQGAGEGNSVAMTAPGAPASTATASSAPLPFAERAARDATRLAKEVERAPRDGRTWLALADAQRRARRFPESRSAYAKAVDLKAMNADAWADYADVLAATNGGSLDGEPADAIRKSLALDPRQTKALWLDASLSIEQKDYPAALTKWQRLRAQIADDSSDARLIDANIREAQELSTGRAPNALTMPAVAEVASQLGKSPPATAEIRISGTVELAPALRARVSPGAALFVYAKIPNARGPPLAVMRTTVDRWPVKFLLDDSMAMMPALRLSTAEQVVVEARVSQTGNAIAAKGDFVATSAVIRTRDAKPVALTIAREVG